MAGAGISRRRLFAAEEAFDATEKTAEFAEVGGFSGHEVVDGGVEVCGGF